MAINLKFDLMGNPEPPSIVLANRNGNKLGQLNVNVDSIDVKDALKLSEFSFTLNKYIDGELTPLWNKVVDFKLVNCPEWDLWFEIKVELDEATETVKTVFCTQLGQAELSQIKVYNIHINEEGDPNWDTNNETYKSTILYDPQNIDASLLHRVLKDKAPHYSIAYVDESIQRIQKTFSFDDTSICDAFDEIAEEIGCLFVYNSNSTKGGKPSRTISVYDLQQNCRDCGHRGEFTDKCPKCGSTNIKYGYGEDTTIFVTSDELATEGIQLVTDTDAVKNCFKLEGGDDLMTATIRNCNPNGSDYIWYFSDALKEDMSDELVEKLESYDKKYKECYDNYPSTLNSNLTAQYNALVEKYDDYYNTKSTCLNCNNKDYFYEQCPNCNSKNILVGQKLQPIDTAITGYSNLTTAYYNTIDLLLYLKSSLMPTPDIETNKTDAKEQIELLTSSTLSPVAVNVKEVKNITETTAKSAVLSMAKVLIKSTYKVDVVDNSSSLSETVYTDNIIGEYKKWTGKLIVTNYSNEEDSATSEMIEVFVGNDAKTFVEQKIEKALNKENTDDYSVLGLFAKEYDDFCAEIKKYALNPLNNFSKACDAVISILAEQGVGDDGSNEDNEIDKATKKALYDALYKPYFEKQQAINKEIAIRESEIAIIEGVWDKSDENNPKCTTDGLQQYIEKCQQEIQESLDFEKHLGEDLWLEFCAYRREDKYSNSNYVSDGLNNAELFKRANEFIAVAEEEIFKSAELQHSISATLNNLLSLPKFKPLLKSFKTGNWIRVQVDDKVYKLRLLEYGFGYGDSESISVEFSDVTKIKNGVTDVKEVLEQASSMASSYDSVQRQAEKGNVARSTIDQWLVDGLNAANMQIASNDSEEVLLTKNGLLARSYDDITGTYSPEQLKITHNIMAYTDDNWETVKQSIGKHGYKYFDKDENKFVDETGYGMNADFVVAGIVSGSQMIGGDIYSDNYSVTDRTGSYLNLRDGTFSFGGGALRFEGGELLISSPNVVTKNEVTTINEEYLKTTSVYAENLRVNAAYIQEKLTAKQIDTEGLIAENISSTTIDGKTITGGSILIGDTTKVNDYAEIANDGTLTCTNVNIQGGILQIGSKNNEETHTWISTDGTLNTYNANISGEIRAAKGTIGSFTIETTETEEDGSKSGGWLYTGESIGSDKSIFLSATDMSGTMPFYSIVERKDEDGNTVYDENDEAIYDVTQSDLEMEDWRITVGTNFGVTSDGTAYMSNAEIIGGSLRMGTEGDGYHTWISSDGVLNASGANINGTITAAGDMGVQYPSLVFIDETSPICFKAGGTDDEVIITNKTFTFTSDGSLWSETISLNDEQKTTYLITNAKCLTSNKIHEGSGESSLISLTSGTVSNEDGYYRISATMELLPSWVSEEHIVELSINNANMDVSYIGDGKVRVDVTTLFPNTTYIGLIQYHYLFDEEVNVSIDISENKDEVTFSFTSQTVDVEYNIDVQYIFEPKDFGFKVLRDGSLYTNDAYIRGRIYATDGEFNGTIYATDGEFNGTIYATDGEFKRGKIACFDLNDNGLTLSKEGQTLSLNTSGIMLSGSPFDFSLGNLKIFHTTNTGTLLSTTGTLTFQGANNTELSLMSDGGDVTTTFEVTANFGVTDLWLGGFGNEGVTFHCSGLSQAPYYPFTVTFWYEFSDGTSGQESTVYSPSDYGERDIQVGARPAARYGKFRFKTLHSDWSDWYGARDIQDNITGWNGSLVGSDTQTQRNNNITIKGNLVPKTNDELYSLGESTRPWNVVYTKDGTVQKSDRNAKNTILQINDVYSELFDRLKPVTYKFNKNESNRTHIGFIAQDVKNSIVSTGLTTQDFAGYCEWENNDGTIGCGLRYGEFIALCVNEIQKLKKRISELEK